MISRYAAFRLGSSLGVVGLIIVACVPNPDRIPTVSTPATSVVPPELTGGAQVAPSPVPRVFTTVTAPAASPAASPEALPPNRQPGTVEATGGGGPQVQPPT